jgi:hypothetical protein
MRKRTRVNHEKERSEVGGQTEEKDHLGPPLSQREREPDREREREKRSTTIYYLRGS